MYRKRWNGYVVVKNEIQVKIILTWVDSQFPLSSNPSKGYETKEFNFYLNLNFDYNRYN